jgi:inhibitor of KinA
VVPTYRSVAVFFDPLRTSYKSLVDWVTRAASAVPEGVVEQSQTLIRVPVCYDEDLGPDLLSVASLANLSINQVVALHASTIYRVFMLGFLPGFAYMGIVDERIRAPRRATPRPRVPRGSVGIAGAQTGVYPLDVPGGWQLMAERRFGRSTRHVTSRSCSSRETLFDSCRSTEASTRPVALFRDGSPPLVVLGAVIDE